MSTYNTPIGKMPKCIDCGKPHRSGAKLCNSCSFNWHRDAVEWAEMLKENEKRAMI